MFWLVSGIVLGFSLIGAGMAYSHFSPVSDRSSTATFKERCVAVVIGLGFAIFCLAVLSPPFLKHIGQWP